MNIWMLLRQSISLHVSDNPENRKNGSQPNQGNVIFRKPFNGIRMQPAIKVKIQNKPVCRNGPIEMPATEDAAITNGTDINSKLSRLLLSIGAVYIVVVQSTQQARSTRLRSLGMK